MELRSPRTPAPSAHRAGATCSHQSDWPMDLWARDKGVPGGIGGSSPARMLVCDEVAHCALAIPS